MQQTTTPRQNLLNAFHHQTPAWTPVVALGDGYNRRIHMPPSFYQEAEGILTCRALSSHFGLDTLDRIGEPWTEQAGSPRGFIVNVVPPPGVPAEHLWLAVDEAKCLAREFF
jgi:hypothetical protein